MILYIIGIDTGYSSDVCYSWTRKVKANARLERYAGFALLQNTKIRTLFHRLQVLGTFEYYVNFFTTDSVYTLSAPLSNNLCIFYVFRCIESKCLMITQIRNQEVVLL